MRSRHRCEFQAQRIIEEPLVFRGRPWHDTRSAIVLGERHLLKQRIACQQDGSCSGGASSTGRNMLLLKFTDPRREAQYRRHLAASACRCDAVRPSG